MRNEVTGIGGWQSQLRTITEAPLTTTQAAATKLSVHHPMVICIQDKLERWKHSVNGYLMMKSQHWRFELFSLCLCNTYLFPHLTVIYKKKGGLYTTTRTTSSMVRPRNSKVMSKAKLAPKGYGHSAIHYSFLNPEKIFMCKTCAQQINNIHQKLQHLQPALANRKPNLSPQ